MNDPSTPSGPYDDDVTRFGLLDLESQIEGLANGIRATEQGKEITLEALADPSNFTLGDEISIYRLGAKDIGRGRAAVFNGTIIEIVSGGIVVQGIYTSSGNRIEPETITRGAVAVTQNEVMIFFGGGSRLDIKKTEDTALFFVKRLKTAGPEDDTRAMGEVYDEATKVGERAVSVTGGNPQ